MLDHNKSVTELRQLSSQPGELAFTYNAAASDLANGIVAYHGGYTADGTRVPDGALLIETLDAATTYYVYLAGNVVGYGVALPAGVMAMPMLKLTGGTNQNVNATRVFTSLAAGDNGGGISNTTATWPPVSGAGVFGYAGSPWSRVGIFDDGSIGAYTAFMRFDTSALADAATVTAARLVLNVESKVAVSAYTVDAGWYDFGVSMTSEELVYPPRNNALADVASATIPASGAWTLPLADGATGVSKTGFTGVAVGAKAPSSGNGWVQVSTAEGGAAVAPQLHVDVTTLANVSPTVTDVRPAWAGPVELIAPGATITNPSSYAAGTEMVTNGSFASGGTGWVRGTGWSTSGAHVAGTASAITQTFSHAPVGWYIINYRTTCTAGTLTASLAGVPIATTTTATTTRPTATILVPAANGTLVFDASADFVGSITSISALYVSQLQPSLVFKYATTTQAQLYASVNGFILSDALSPLFRGTLCVGFGPKVFNALSGGSENTAFGESAAKSLIDGSANSAFGRNALVNCTNGSNNVAAGYSMFCWITTGGHNVGVGVASGLSVATGSYNTVVGSDNGPNGDYSYTLSLGAYAAPTGNNLAVIGGPTTGTYGVTLGLGTNTPATSDGRGFHIASKILRIETPKTPASADALGYKGEHCWDDNFFYLATADNNWKSMPLGEFQKASAAGALSSVGDPMYWMM